MRRQSKYVLDLLGQNARLALASKVTVLDKIEKTSAFAKKVLDATSTVVELGTAVSEVYHISSKQKTHLSRSHLGEQHCKSSLRERGICIQGASSDLQGIRS